MRSPEPDEDGLSLDPDEPMFEGKSALEEEEDRRMVDMLEAFSELDHPSEFLGLPLCIRCKSDVGLATLAHLDHIPDAVRHLQEIIDSPPDAHTTYTRIKKDIFHVFYSLPISRTHGAAAPFYCTLQNHIMRFDHESRKKVDSVCRKSFNLSFDQMLERSPRWVAERTPCYIPPPSVLVIAIQHVYAMFADAKDARTGDVLFTPAV